MKADYAGVPRSRRASRASASSCPSTDSSALAVSARGAASASTRTRWQRGGLGFAARVQRPAYATRRPTTPPPSSCAPRSAPSCATRRRRGALPARTIPSARKRICVDTGYYETYNRRQRHAGRSPARRRSRRSPRAACKPQRREYELDSIVFATGFDAMTGALLEHRHPRPRRRHAAREVGRRARAPTSASPWPGFPNLFTITGPGSPSVLSNMMVSIEQHVDWIADCLAHLREHGSTPSRRRAEAEDAWVDHVNEVGERHALPAGQLLVHGREHPRQAARLHALCRRGRRLPRACDESRPTATTASY